MSSTRPRRKPLEPGPGDHGAIVGAKTRRRERARQPRLAAETRQRGGWRHWPRRRPPPPWRWADGFPEETQASAAAIDDHIHHRRLERGAEIGDIGGGRGATRSTSSRTAVFRPEKEKSGFGRPSMGRGKSNRVASPSRRLLDPRAAGIGQAEQLGRLVESLAEPRRRRSNRVADNRRPRSPRRTGYGRRTPAAANREMRARRSAARVSAWASR